MPDGNRKPEGGEIDPAKLLEIELMQKRAEWQQAKARRGGLRALAFLFLFAVIVAAIVCFYLFFSGERAREHKPGEAETIDATPAVP